MMAAAPAFDPSQPFEAVGAAAPPPFDPSKPFEAVPSFGSDEHIKSLAKKHGASEDYVRSLAEAHQSGEVLKGTPIAGGFIEKAGAGVSALAQPLTGAGAGGGSISERYKKNLALENELYSDFERERPIESTALQLGGGLLTTGGAGATATGAKYLGMAGSLPARIGYGAASGAGINAADAAVRGENPWAGAAIGGGLGAAIPVAGRAVSALAQPLINTVRGAVNPAAQATRNVAGAIERDVQAGGAGMTQPEFAQATAAGQPANLMDLGGETTRGLARSAANTSPEGRQILNRAIDDRFEAQSGRLNDWFNSKFNFPDAESQRTALSQAQRTSNRTNYAKAMMDGASGIWSPELERLAGSDAVANAAKNAASSYRDEAIIGGYGAANPKVSFTPDGRMQFAKGPSGVPVYPDLQFWDLTRRELSDAASAAYRQGRATEGRRLSSFADSLNNELDKQVPSYVKARSTASRFFGAHDALDAGENFAMSRTQDNQGVRNALAQMSPLERQLFQDGFVSRFKAQLNESGDRRNIVAQIANSPAKRERLEMALGPQRARELQTMLHVENVMDQARGAVQGNSTTARQLTELGLAGGAYGVATGGNVTNPDPTSLMVSALTYGLAKGRGAINTNVARQVAQMLASNDANRLNTGMRIIAGNPAMRASLQRFDQALAKSGAVQLTPGPQSTSSNASFDPASIGARQAADGNHYVADPARPGKYLRVAW